MRQFAAAILPCLSFVRVAYNGANMLLCDQQIFSKDASNLSCDSGNCIHRVALPRKLLAEMEETPFAPLSGSVASWTLVFPPSLSSIGAFGPPISVFTQPGCAELTLILVSRNS